MDSPTLHSFWGYSIKDVEHALVSVIQEYRQVHGCKEIFLHGFDWGAQVSLALASHHPHLITKLVVQDVGTIRLNEMPLYDLFVIVAYQSFLGTLFLFSRLFGSNQDSASRIITPLARCFPWQLLMFPNDNIVRSILHQNYAPYKGYPYFRMLFDFLTDYAWLRFTTSVPQFFAFGRLKHISFHSKSYLRQLERTPGCFYKGYNGSHWFHKSQEAEFQCDVLEFFGPLTG
jgi:pimeloyl-ACP methyl ester carboxylesterase